MWPLALLSLVSASIVVAEEISVEYSSFYSHTKQLEDEALDALQFAFGFIYTGQDGASTGELCAVNEPRIVTEKVTIPLETLGERFLVPSKEVLKLAKARVVAQLSAPANRCDMSVQLETKPDYLQSRYQQAELELLFAQYQKFFDKMGGWMSFMMPTVIGLKFQYESAVAFSDMQHGGAQMAKQHCVPPERFASLAGQTLPVPMRIGACLQRD